MSLALIVTDRPINALREALTAQLPGVRIQCWPDIDDFESIEWAVLWKQPPGLLARLPNLRAVSSLGAGVEGILEDADLPPDVPVFRVVPEDLKEQMAQYVLSHVLSDLRSHRTLSAQQRRHEWRVLDAPRRAVVGFLGLGQLGRHVAAPLASLGLSVCAWTRGSAHRQWPCHHGTDGLRRVLSACDYLVNLLPLTAQTRGLLDAELWSQCARKPLFINVARGAHVVEADLLAALDRGQLRGAVLDVFKQEPLPGEHPFWSHPAITVTPHLAARSDTEQTAAQLGGIFRAVQTGDFSAAIDRQRAY